MVVSAGIYLCVKHMENAELLRKERGPGGTEIIPVIMAIMVQPFLLFLLFLLVINILLLKAPLKRFRRTRLILD